MEYLNFLDLEVLTC